MSSQASFEIPSRKNTPSRLFPSETILGSTPSPSMPQKPMVVGLCGPPGCGKSFTLNQLKNELGQQEFEYYEGAAVIASLVHSGGLGAFQKMEEQEKTSFREKAIDKIREECATSGRIAVVAGHFMFWNEHDESGHLVWTQRDQETFSHMLYLDIPASTVKSRRQNDSERVRSPISEEHIHRWQRAECNQLRLLCLEHGILFSAVVPDKVAMLLRTFRLRTEQYNLASAQQRLDEVVRGSSGQVELETMVVLDGDRTLIAEDTGAIFWKLFQADKMPDDLKHTGEKVDPLKELFSSPFGYSYAAFCQAALIYEEVPAEQFDRYCETVASSVTLYPEMVSLLKLTERPVGAVVITCGVRLIWEKILHRAGLSKTVKVIGGGRIGDGLIITDEVKAALVRRLRDVHSTYVCAFGDSVLDLAMLKKANQAVVVVGEQRSRTMEAALLNAIDNEGLRAWQTLLPKTAARQVPRLDTIKLPVIDITEAHIIDAIVFRCSRKHLEPSRTSGESRVFLPKENTTKLLMTPMRDASVFGLALQEAHRRVGRYLAMEFIPELIGLEEISIQHVQGTQTAGFRLRHENKTLIVALMRGGEPMAFGVSEAFPLASFHHAKIPEDVQDHHVKGQETVILVDSVINSGKTVVAFVLHIRKLLPAVRILVVAGVIQSQSIEMEGTLAQISTTASVDLIALRLSNNRFTGKGTTDTGNRLFNTTHLQ